MPHILVKMYAGRSSAQKQRLADALAQALRSVTGHSEASISVRIADVEPSDWMEEVYAPEIADGPGKLYKQPGYGPLAEREP